MVHRQVAPPRRGAHPRAGASGQGKTTSTATVAWFDENGVQHVLAEGLRSVEPDTQTEPRAPTPDHLVLCPLDCARPLDQCHCLRGMLEDRGLAAIDPDNIWLTPSPTPGTIHPEPDDTPSPAPLLIALALGVTAAASFGLAWWLA